MNFRIILFILVYFLACLCISSADEEALDVEIKESPIELTPFDNFAIADNTANAENANIDVIKQPVSQEGTEQTEKITVNIAADDEEVPEGQKSSTTDINKSEAIQENLTIPVFSEWTQQQIQEAEKKLVEVTGNSTESNKDTKKNETLAKNQIVKMMRQKNYASPDCGAKVLASNAEAQSSSSVLSDKDEYMLSPCTDRIWFVIELCDSIQAKRVELANFELFSSPLKAVSISVSNRFPTRDWTTAGHYDAKSERDVQVFELRDVTLFGKFVRVDVEYTNTEHYCPLSFFRIFGTSEIEAFEVENEPDNRINNHIDDDDESSFVNNQNQKIESSKDNILNRAGAAVMSMVQKAAEVLVKSNGNGAKEHVTSSKQYQDTCMTLSHDILCEICSNDDRTLLSNMITCKNAALKQLLADQVKEHLVNSVTCASILGFHLKSDSIETSRNFLASILPETYIAAMCNLVAGDQNALPPKLDVISEITSKLISKKDEVSLKNISDDVQCKQSVNNDSIESLQSQVLKNVINTTGNVTESKDDKLIKIGSKNFTDDQNIFNKIERQPLLTEEVDEPLIPESMTDNLQPDSAEQQVVAVEIRELSKDEEKKTEMTNSQAPKASDVKNPKTNEPASDGGNKEEPRASNAPESVFLRLSNRIKVLEKNMTLSTQYLEELSRRYKKQIEDLQQAYSKLQLLYDNLNQSKKESDKKDIDDKRQLKDDIDDISKKSDFLEIVLIVLASFFILQIIFIIVLFKRLSILRDAFVMNDCLATNEDVTADKSRSATNGTKKKSKRIRKISAPNILSQRGMTNGCRPNEFHVTLNRTASVPMKVNEMLEHIPDIDQSTMLEENDEIVLQAFDELTLNDVSSGSDVAPKNIEENDFDTTSTASARTEELNVDNVGFVRRLSSPTFLKLKLNNGRKAKSASPTNVKSGSHNISLIQKSNSFEEDAKFRKNNSFKKLFKKLF